MSRCAGIKATGGACEAQAIAGNTWCYNHHPDYAEARRKRGSKGGRRGGRGRPAPATLELARLQARFEELAEELVEKPGRAERNAVMGRLFNYSRQCVRDSIQAREQEELVQRLEDLERALAERSNRFGA